MNHKVYIASPLFSESDHKGLDIIEKYLDDAGISYFSPRKHSTLDMSKATTQSEKDAIAQKIFDLNISAVRSAELILVNTVGTRWSNAIYSDAGTMVEAGIAIALDIPILTYNFLGYGLNIMLSQKSVYHCDSLTYDDQIELNVISQVVKDIQVLESIGKTMPHELPKLLRDKFFKLKEMELV